MSQKDYRLIAKCVNEAAKTLYFNKDIACRTNVERLTQVIGEEFCSMLKADNSLFKKETFLEACKNG